jgi:predicted  nucleic acid-binding Zn-ribbon protein
LGKFILSDNFPKDQYAALPSPLDAAKLLDMERERLEKYQAEFKRIQNGISEEEARIKTARARSDRAAAEAEKQEAIARSLNQVIEGQCFHCLEFSDNFLF